MPTIDFIRSLELPTGGIAAWQGYAAYPEVSGYLIPTLIAYGEDALANRVADWLERIQNDDGSFSSMDGIPHSFDTAAIVEGLRATGRTQAEARALAWLGRMLNDDGLLRIRPGVTLVHARDFRSLAVMGRNLDGVPPRRVDGMLAAAERSHYLLYALEGMLSMGYTETVRAYLETVTIDTASHLVPFWLDGKGSDTCATAQAACLRLRLGMDAKPYLDAVRSLLNDDGSLPHDKSDRRKTAWTCKYYLDAENYVRTSILPDAPLRERPEKTENVRSGNRKAKK